MWNPVPFGYKYLDDNALKQLDNYKYYSEDHSVVAKYIMQPFWSKAVNFLPPTIAPNMITLLGFIINVSAYTLVCYFAPTLQSECPSWVWYYAALSLFVYQTLDALDGKQARRTGTSSPVGELFDHGCDALSTPIICLTLCNALGVPNLVAYCYTCLIGCGFYFAQWEQFHTGKFVLGYVNGPTDGLLMNVAILGLTGIYGKQFWHQVYFGYSIWKLLIGFAATSAGITFITNILHTFTRPKDNTEVYNSRIGSLVPGLSIVLVITLLGLRFPKLLLQDNVRMTSFLLGSLLSYSATRLTVSRVSRMKFKNNYSLLAPLSVATLLFFMIPAVISVPDEKLTVGVFYFCWVYTIGSVYFYLHLMLAIFSQLTEHFKINLLTMTDQQAKLAPQKILELRAKTH
eukprot:PhF_6_TR39885/c0_g1_i1/m.59294/K00993/EPT1; ethanolaminephosphotransferase